MTEAEAKEWLTTSLGVSRETMESLDAFVAFLKRESVSQNLIAASTIEDIWSRHIVDSAQLLTFVDRSQPETKWLDLGSGAGFPGLIIALLTDFEVTLVESRTRRIEYLQRAVEMLDIGGRVTVIGMPLERMKTAPFSVISARAFAPLPKLFELAARFSHNNTLWLLPKGRNAAAEWDDVKTAWDGAFSVKQSITDADAGILVGTLAGKRKGGGSAGAKGQKP
ncbi:MAG: 16S rRNA (guanine(527)-N(7))-methyltransferase RsmG [Sphingorhabdus sp.]|jgi:16S rRNA (guanine527-N7)-methyltransferase|uniref:16S rRNA (guanine(527)-N(7))-methyltransferase RsmG n=1 Tax=Sphingorhabdus sp. TaxID=1902408 RepID=UPI00273DABD5|nr:16S rRNA (guanine(527)-N(7))-methyltransferase RsmG [Sphingorhabdus sp.]MDP4926831.1 16S rRNA (guanine(527)-N(7))-methyltransferase RsmG [Sphingorhabdus sp.]